MKIMFVCLGNICRSPTAHGIAIKLIRDSQLNQVTVTSSGTASYHVGSPPDKRATEYALSKGVDLSVLRAQQLQKADFYEQDLILVMDQSNYENALALRPDDATAKVEKLLWYYPNCPFEDVPDPYYGEDEGFAQVFHLCEVAITHLLEDISKTR